MTCDRLLDHPASRLQASPNSGPPSRLLRFTPRRVRVHSRVKWFRQAASTILARNFMAVRTREEGARLTAQARTEVDASLPKRPVGIIAARPLVPLSVRSRALGAESKSGAWPSLGAGLTLGAGSSSEFCLWEGRAGQGVWLRGKVSASGPASKLEDLR